MTPFDKWYGYKPFVVHFKVSRSHAWVHISKEKCNNLQPTSQCCVLVGYSKISKVYRLYDHSTNKVIERTVVVFEEVLVDIMVAAGGINLHV